MELENIIQNKNKIALVGMNSQGKTYSLSKFAKSHKDETIYVANETKADESLKNSTDSSPLVIWLERLLDLEQLKNLIDNQIKNVDFTETNQNNNVNVSLKNSTINYKGLIATDIVTNSNDWKLPGSGEVFYGELLIIEKMLSNNLDNPIKYLIIDEPETFLHPSLYINMCSLLKKISNNVRVIISTHSPLILKYFIDELNEIIVVSKGNFNQLKLSRDYIIMKDNIDLYSKSNCYKTTKKALEHFENYFEVFIKPVIFECLFSRVVVIGEGLGEQIIFECFKNKYLNFSKISSASFITFYGKDFIPLLINIIKDIGLEVVVIYDKDSNKSKDNEINNFINEFIEKNVEHRIGFNIDLEERLGIQRENDGTFKSIVVPSEIRNMYLNNDDKILSLLQEIKDLIDKI